VQQRSRGGYVMVGRPTLSSVQNSNGQNYPGGPRQPAVLSEVLSEVNGSPRLLLPTISLLCQSPICWKFWLPTYLAYIRCVSLEFVLRQSSVHLSNSSAGQNLDNLSWSTCPIPLSKSVMLLLLLDILAAMFLSIYRKCQPFLTRPCSMFHVA
jgi:hypothetical protein